MAVTTEATPGRAADGPEGGGRRGHWLRHTLGWVGQLLVTVGVVLLLLVAYQLWGTNLQTSRSQDQLESEFAQTAGGDSGVIGGSGSASTTTTSPSATTPASTAPTTAPPAIGDVVGRLSIPSIGVRNFYFVEGVGVDELKRGAAHYPETPLPGQAGNAAIAGHRTTWGAPFHNIDHMKKGDIIDVTTVQGSFRYKMTEVLIVSPLDTYVLDDAGDNRLTLTACHPKLSSKQRIVIHAVLIGNPVDRLAGQGEPAAGDAAPARTAIDEFQAEPIARFPGAWWGLVCLAAWVLVRGIAWALRKSSIPVRALPYIVGVPICLVLLYVFFESVSYEALSRTLHL